MGPIGDAIVPQSAERLYILRRAAVPCAGHRPSAVLAHVPRDALGDGVYSMRPCVCRGHHAAFS